MKNNIVHGVQVGIDHYNKDIIQRKYDLFANKFKRKYGEDHCLENVEEGLPKLTFWVYDEESKHGIGTITLSIIQFQYDENLGYGLLIDYLDNENGSNHYIDDLDDL